MELKNNNLKDEIFLASKLNPVQLFFLIVKIEFKNEFFKLFFQLNA